MIFCSVRICELISVATEASTEHQWGTGWLVGSKRVKVKYGRGAGSSRLEGWMAGLFLGGVPRSTRGEEAAARWWVYIALRACMCAHTQRETLNVHEC
jgi:hypothetical protein